MTDQTVHQPLTDQQLDEIETRANALNDRGLPGGTWQTSPRDEKSVVPPEMAHVVEDVLRTKAALLRSSVGVFGDEAHAEFVAHAPADIDALVVEVRRLGAELECRTEDQAVEPGALASWLHWRFGPHGQPWADVADEDKALWEHQARATRRAVERGGFKAPAPAAVVSSAAETPGSAR